MTDKKSPSLGDIDDLGESASRIGPRSERGLGPKGGLQFRHARALGGGNHWLWATLVLGVLVAVLSVWFFRQISVLQAQLDNKLNTSTEQLGNLASQLSATDETITQSAEKITDTLSLHDSEIRKLWGVSNDRNKKWIQTNQEKIAALEKARSESDKASKALRAELQRLDGALKQYVIARNQIQTQIDLLNETIKQIDARTAAQKQLVDKLAAIRPQLEALAKLQAAGEGLDGRLLETEAAIQAFDAYRREVNVRLDKLEAGSP